MSKGLKIFLWIVAIIAVFAIAGFLWAKNAIGKISFSKPNPQGLNLSGITMANIANNQSNITATIGLDIQNDNSFSIPISNLKVRLLYKGSVIAQTSDDLLNPMVVPANGTLSLSDIITINVNNSSTFLIEKIKGNSVSLDYIVDVSIWNIPISKLFPIKNTITW